MADEATTPGGEQQETVQPQAQAAAPAAADTEKMFSQADMDAAIASRLARFKDTVTEKKAQELASEALTEVATIKEQLAAAQLEVQLSKLASQGADIDLLKATGLKGEALDGFAAQLIAKVPAGEQKPKPGSASSDAAIAAFINKSAASALTAPEVSANGVDESWLSGVLDTMGKEFGKR